MRTLLTVLLLVMAFGASAATITYRWVDAEGVVHYSDMPRPGAEQIQLAPAQGYTPVTPAPARPASTDAAAFQYDSVEIVSPYEEEVLFNIETRMTVRVILSPALRPNHFLRLTIDGEDVTTKPVRSTSFQVEGIFRGTHKAQVTVVDKDGKVVQQSPVRTFHVRQNVAKPQQNIVTPQPRPKPQSS